MMNDCSNAEIRDLLPELLNGTLSAAQQQRVAEHVQTCAECAAELTVLRAARAALRAAPRLDADRIVRALPAPRLAGGNVRGGARQRLPLAAAALLVGVAGAGLYAARRAASDGPASTVLVGPRAESNAERPPSGVASEAVPSGGGRALLAAGVGELDEAALDALLAEIETLDGEGTLPSAEPSALIPALLDEEGV